MLTRSSSPWSLLVMGVLTIACVRTDPEGRVSAPTPSAGAAPRCEGADALARVWTPEQREAFRGALGQSAGQWPEQAFTSLDARVAEHGEAWARTYASACERGELAIMRCLDGRVAKLDALMAAIVEQPERAAAAWSEIDRSVADPSSCEAHEGADPWLALDQLRDSGAALIERDEPDKAIAPLAQAIALSTRLRGPENPHTAALQALLAEAQFARGEVEAAHDSLIQARDAFVIALGPDHPQTLATVEAIGRSFIAAGRPGDAQFAFLDLLEINRELYGPKHWRTAKIKLELGDSLMAMDQHQGAQTLYTEALTPLAQALGPEHPAVIRASIHLGIAELALGNLEAAELHCARGRDLAKALPPGNALATEAEQCVAELGSQ